MPSRRDPSAERTRIRQNDRRAPIGSAGARTSASAPGAPSARTTARRRRVGVFPHDHARSRAYRWNEDGLAGICDRHQRICFALALWNGRDPILKERLFGLTGNEGNHGEDVKEYYFYLDSTPTHSYMQFLYKYPQARVPLCTSSWRRTGARPRAPEFELVDTGVFDGGPLLRRVRRVREGGHRRHPDPDQRYQPRARGRAALHVLPTVWFRNTWSWAIRRCGRGSRRVEARAGASVIALDEPSYGRALALLRRAAASCCSPRTRPTRARLFGVTDAPAITKDGINDSSSTATRARSTRRDGTKAAAHYPLMVPAGEHVDAAAAADRPRAGSLPEGRFGPAFDEMFARRRREADEFYATVIPETTRRRTRGTSCARRLPACSGPSSSTTTS